MSEARLSGVESEYINGEPRGGTGSSRKREMAAREWRRVPTGCPLRCETVEAGGGVGGCERC